MPASPRSRDSGESGSSASAAERAYESTKRAIIHGQLAAGTMTSELLVCQQLGLSRTPVHEAFLRLASEGLLSLESRKGAVIRPMSPNEARDVLEMREAVEAMAAARVVTDGATAELAAALENLLAAQEQAIANHDTAAFVDADDTFHTAIVVASGNAVAAHFIQFLRDRQQRLRHQLFRVRPEEFAAVLDQHRRLAAALSERDAGRYRALLAEHVATHGVAS
ncbi:MAG TPA: GntR family transcriptional regulator [Trebonia sp.]|jgi:DNA-binding GntR family transcriptional regulator|nr:GntR family transcriptional regulator [Trebonia sp.]